MWAQGSPGIPGRNGHNGLPGQDGRGGAKGEKEVTGSHGPRGIKEEAGKIADEERNWKQCAWKKAEGRFGGLIKVSGRQFPGEGGVLLGILGGGVLRGSSNPYPISHQKM